MSGGVPLKIKKEAQKIMAKEIELSAADIAEMRARLAELESGYLPMKWEATANGWEAPYMVKLDRADIQNTLDGNHRNSAGEHTSTTAGGTGPARRMTNPRGVPSTVTLKIMVGIRATGNGTI